jgi:hypothetical protein
MLAPSLAAAVLTRPVVETPIAIVANGGTIVVAAQGGGVYRISKSGGVDGTWDADAVSSVGAAGDFTLQAVPRQNGAAGIVGMNADPLTDSSYTSIDFAIDFFSDGNVTLFESNVVAGSLGPYSALQTWWIYRRSGRLYYARGGTGPANAEIVRGPVASSATLFFDSSIQNINTCLIDVRLTVPS